MTTAIEGLRVHIQEQDPPVKGLKISFSGELSEEIRQSLQEALLEKQEGSLDDIIKLVAPKLNSGSGVTLTQGDISLTISKT